VRLVLDTNVVFSGLLWQGPPHQVLEFIRQQPNMQLFSSAVLIEELADVLTRPAATRRLALIGRGAREVLADYVEVVDLVEPIEVPRVVPNDPDDDQVIAAARAARADCIVSGDSDLLSLGRFEGIEILTAAGFLARFAAK
jgi:putative PIN family toxin of toxin-antitoxin system